MQYIGGTGNQGVDVRGTGNQMTDDRGQTTEAVDSTGKFEMESTRYPHKGLARCKSC
jgi:hypothetical protein